MEFHEKLQELKKSRGLTQEELADALFVSRTAISKWESGRGYPSIDSLKEISRYFSVASLNITLNASHSSFSFLEELAQSFFLTQLKNILLSVELLDKHIVKQIRLVPTLEVALSEWTV